jgi:ATP-dependent Clp protease ATP-binding subunit ClpA
MTKSNNQLPTENAPPFFDKKINSCAKTLALEIYGQDIALKRIEETLQAASLLLNDGQPTASMLFNGPRGIGKHSTAIYLNQLLNGVGSRLLHFDLAEYPQNKNIEHVFKEIISLGISGEHTICLIEKIELATPQFIRLLTDTIQHGYSNKHDFSNTIFIMTAEIENKTEHKQELISEEENNSELLQLVLDDLPGSGAEDYFEITDMDTTLHNLELTLTQKFGENFMQNIAIIPFMKLSINQLTELTNKQLENLKTRLKEKHSLELQFQSNLAHNIINLLPPEKQSPGRIKQFIREKFLPEIGRLKPSLEPNSVLKLAINQNAQISCQIKEKS